MYGPFFFLNDLDSEQNFVFKLIFNSYVCYDPELTRNMLKSSDQFDSSDCVCSFGMKLTWDINDPKLPQVKIQYFYAFLCKTEHNV